MLSSGSFSIRPRGFLRDAAELSTDDQAFAQFLRARADALLNDNYYPSDLLWVDLRNPKIDVIFAPYETYLDDVLGVKTSYSSAILIRNEPESQKLELYQKYVPDIQDALPLPAADRPSKRGHLTPMEVMDAPLRTGDLLHGYQAVADNLPERSANSRSQRNQENLLQELHGRARELRGSAAGEVHDACQPRRRALRAKAIWLPRSCTRSRTGSARPTRG